MNPNVLFFDTVGAPFTFTSTQRHGTGGSELEIARIATALSARGHKVVVANNVDSVSEEPDGVVYLPYRLAADFWPSKALCITRYSKTLAMDQYWTRSVPRIVVRATDLCCDAYDIHRELLSSGRAALYALTKWHAGSFTYAREQLSTPMPLGPAPSVEKVPRRFIYGAGPVKGLDATLKMWLHLRDKYPELHDAELVLMSPGWGDWPWAPGSYDAKSGVRYIGVPPPAEYQRLIASAEGLFYVSTFTETFCCMAALAERDRTRTHILCKNGLGGIPEAIGNHRLLTTNDEVFELDFIAAYRDPTNPKWYADKVPDRSAAALVLEWEKTLHLEPKT